MSRALVILIISFAVGAALALIVRAGLHRPYDMSDASMPATAPMSMAGPHDGHGDQSGLTPATATGAPHHHHVDDHSGGLGTAPMTPVAEPGAAAARAPGVTSSSQGVKPSASAVAPGSSAPADPLDASGIFAIKPGRDTVNTICPVCGNEVEATLPTSTYHGKVIGFGCRANRCKEKFDADPDRFGPAAVANRKAE